MHKRDIDECMVTEYPKAFLEWYEREGFAILPAKDRAFRLWIATMEEFQRNSIEKIKDMHAEVIGKYIRNKKEELYEIGEEVLVNGKPGVVLAHEGNGTVTYNPNNVRRKPAWMPKENEPVFVEVNGKATIGVWGTGYVHVGNNPGLRFSEVKPYNPAKIGKPWDEV